jgi:hypothetical protein
MIKDSLKKIFSRNKKSETVIVVQINDKIMPIFRGELYEDPLDKFLYEHGFGEIVGGGTMQAQSGEIQFCDIQILLNPDKDPQKVIEEVQNFFESMGVPKGSFITIEGSYHQINIGNQEGLAIYLDGTGLPDEVYAQCDSNFVLSELSKLIGYDGEIERYWEGNTETALYFYGESFETMKESISEFVNTYPLCKNSRIVQIA